MTTRTVLKLIRFEWRLLLAERTAPLAIALFVLFAGCAIWNGFMGLRQQCAAAAELVKEHDALIGKARRAVADDEQQTRTKGEPLNPARQNARHPVSVLNRLSEFQVSLPLSSFTVFGAGQSELFPTTWKYRASEESFVPAQPTSSTHLLGGLIPERPIDNPLKTLLGRFDLGFVVLYFYPLLILALSFNLLAGDKENGTLALTLAQPVRLGTLVLSKVAVRALLILVTGILLPGLAVYLCQRWLKLETSAARIWLWMLAVSSYSTCWFGLALWVNGKGRSAAGNALALIVCWITQAVIIPALVNLAAPTFFPVPSGATWADAERVARFEATTPLSAAQQEILNHIRARHPVIEGDEETLRQYRRALFEEYFDMPQDCVLLDDFLARHPEVPRVITSIQFGRIATEARAEYLEAKLAPLLARINGQREKQQRLMTICGLLSPTLLLQHALGDLAGTSRVRHEHFLGQLESYIHALDELLYPKIYRNESVSAAELARLRAFTYREESLADIALRAAWPCGLLLVMAALLSLHGLRLCRQYPVIG